MKRKSRAFRPGTTGLEPRAMTSAVEVAVVALPTTQIAGRLSGRYQAGMDNRAADAPLRVNLTGNGPVPGQGRIRLSGSLDFGGFRVAGAPDITGTVRLTNARGSVTLQLAGSGGFSQIPRNRFTLNATVVDATGVYAGLQGTGTATAQFARSTLRARTPQSPIAGAASTVANG